MTNLTKLQAQVLTLPRGKDGRVQYTNAFHKEVCDIVRSGEHTQASLSRALNVKAFNIYNWMRNTRTADYDTKGIAVSRMRPSNPVAALEAKRNDLLAEMDKISTALKLLKELGL
jgi:hypothetical protein